MIAIYYGAPVDDKYRKIIKLSIISICKFFDYNIFVIDTKKTNKLKNLLNDNKIKFIKCNLENETNWSSVIEKDENLISKYNIDKIIYFRTSIIGGFKRGNYGIIEAYEKHVEEGDDSFSFNFNTIKNLLVNYMFLKACSNKNIEVYQFFTDVQELPFGEVLNFKKYRKLYLANTKDFICMPAFEYGLSLEKSDNIKTKDFCFYCTALTDDRKYMIDKKFFLESHEGYDCKIVIDEKDKDNKSIKQEEYDKKLSNAKFTLAIPAYDINHFSIWRIFEALENNCLCLVLSNCNLYDIQVTYPTIYKIINKYCIVESIEDIDNKIKELDSKYIDIINEIRNTPEYKKITDLEYCKRRWKRMLGEVI